MREVAIVSATRTAIGTYGGSLKDIPVVDQQKVGVEPPNGPESHQE